MAWVRVGQILKFMKTSETEKSGTEGNMPWTSLTSRFLKKITFNNNSGPLRFKASFIQALIDSSVLNAEEVKKVNEILKLPCTWKTQ